MSDPIRFRHSVAGGVMVLTFDHPPTRNALDRVTRARLVEVLQEVDAAPDVRVIVLTGTDPAFTSGVDAKQLLGEPDYEPLPLDPATALRALATPTIAAVNGSCVSGGLEIALACSMVIASAEARFADTHAKLGLTPGWGLSAELPAAVGVWRARQLTLTGQPIDARTAYEWGLVNEVVDHGLLQRRALDLAGAIAELDPAGIGNAVRLYADGQQASWGAARAVERVALSAWTVDRSSARAAFDQRVSPPST
ncbi:enoyl-CoA hydratase [Microbacterium trichothecenolyticum]|uniref:enoyl-CoA hydratase-related protein n=1 Tax=Microbacterium trichothecenolyticum TaxID=69370 RepID=UPI00286629B8|nr:enoyl-CoA hydratase-related protein [Microbacterium trichothecenolyticum]MDR7112252.1 enoyl-CoA hydratase [Microbacterium trichothecenolyticum]